MFLVISPPLLVEILSVKVQRRVELGDLFLVSDRKLGSTEVRYRGRRIEFENVWYIYGN